MMDDPRLSSLNTEIIDKYHIHFFQSYETRSHKTFANSLHVERLAHLCNPNFVFLILGECCLILPYLCAIRWKYLEKKINDYPVTMELMDIGTNDTTDTETPVETSSVPVHPPEISTSFGCPVINLTTMLLDSGILPNVRYTYLHSVILRFLYEDNAYHMYIDDSEIQAFRPFMDLLIPPDNYWTKTADQVMLETPAATLPEAAYPTPTPTPTPHFP